MQAATQLPGNRRYNTKQARALICGTNDTKVTVESIHKKGCFRPSIIKDQNLVAPSEYRKHLPIRKKIAEDVWKKRVLEWRASKARGPPDLKSILVKKKDATKIKKKVSWEEGTLFGANSGMFETHV